MLEDDLKHCKTIRTKKAARNLIRRRNGRYSRLNNRRFILINKKVRYGLDEEEEKEFNILQKEVGRLVELAYPHPKFPAKLLKYLEDKC